MKKHLPRIDSLTRTDLAAIFKIMQTLKTYIPALLAMTFSLPAQGTIILKMDLPQVVGRSDKIFVGTPVKMKSHWTDDGRHIVTDITFKVDRDINGTKAGETIVIRQLGGSVDGIGMKVSGTPNFQLGKQVVMFTELRSKFRYVVGMSQGVYYVNQEKPEVPRVNVNMNGLGLMEPSKTGLKLLKQAPQTTDMVLNDFIKKVHQTIDLCTKEKDRCQMPQLKGKMKVHPATKQ